MSLDTPPSPADPDAVAGAASLRTRYNVCSETRNHSTDEQLDGESFRPLRPPPGSSRLKKSTPPTGTPSDHVDSDVEIDVIVRKASSQYPEAVVESVRTDGSRSPRKNGPATKLLVCDPGRPRSRTVSSVPQSPGSFVKLAQDKLLRVESDSSFSVNGTVSSMIPGSRHGVTTLTPSSSLTVSSQPLHHPSTSQPSSDSTSKESITMQVPSTPGRVQSAPVRREESPDHDVRPNAGRSRSETTVRSSPTKRGPEKLSDVRKRIEELEAKMRGNRK